MGLMYFSKEGHLYSVWDHLGFLYIKKKNANFILYEFFQGILWLICCNIKSKVMEFNW